MPFFLVRNRNSILRDRKRRVAVSQHELKRVEYQSTLQDLSLPRSLRYSAQLKLNLLLRDSSKTRVNNRCIITGRGRAVYKFCKLSRIAFREMAGQGLLPGFSKSSW